MTRYLFHIVTSFLLIFLFIISPFNQNFIIPDISVTEYNFIILKFWFLFSWAVLFLSCFYILEKKRNKYFYPFLVWNAVFFFLCLTFNLGFDLTDEGWQTAKSWGVLHGSLQNNSDLIWGSSFFNGLWLSIINSPLLVWSRIAYLVSVPFTGVFIYLILKEFYNKKFAFISVVFAFLLFNNSFIIYPVMNYYYLPVVSSLISFYFLVKHNKSNGRSIKYIIYSGIFAGISIHFKFTYILIVPAVEVFIFAFSEKESKLKTSLYFLFSLCSILLLGFLILLISGSATNLIYQHNRLSIFDMISSFLGKSELNSSLNYSALKLFNQYLTDMISVINYGVFSFVTLAISSYLCAITPRLKYILIPVVAIVFYLFIFQSIPESHLKTISVVLSSSALIILSLKSDKNDFILVSYVFFSVFALSVLGTGTSFYGGIFSLGFFGFTSLTIISSVSYQFERFNLKIVFPIMIAISILFQLLVDKSPCRDLPVPYLNTMFKSPELLGIYSFKERVDVVDGFMAFAKTEKISDKKVIFVAMPMLYYILNIKPVISETHDVILGFEQLKKEVIEADPDIIVMPVQSPRGRFWPLPQNAEHWTNDGFERRTAHYYRFYNDYIASNNFNIIFENAMFIAYRKQEVNNKDSLP